MLSIYNLIYIYTESTIDIYKIYYTLYIGVKHLYYTIQMLYLNDLESGSKLFKEYDFYFLNIYFCIILKDRFTKLRMRINQNVLNNK